MQDLVTITGMIIKTVPIGEFDRRVVILTKERGKISAFVKGARRQNSRFMASSNLFCFGTFRLYEGKSTYNMSDAEVTNYFEKLRGDYEGAYYGMYFLEIADYYTRENNDEREMLKLLYQSLRALSAAGLSHRLVRSIYEIKAVMVNGEFPGMPDKLLDSTAYAISYMANAPIEKLYTFTVREDVLEELEHFAKYIVKRCMNTHFNSLDIIDTMTE